VSENQRCTGINYTVSPVARVIVAMMTDDRVFGTIIATTGIVVCLV
jgi:hypothetical protein